MKIMHLSDLHIGKRIYEYSMLEDQEYILDRILEIAEREKPEAVILAGDLYDKPVPPAEAVSLLDVFFSRLASKERAILAISGNHDSPERLSFGSSLMRESRVFFSTVYQGEIPIVTLEDEIGPVDFYLLPFLKPAAVRKYFPEEEIESYTDAIRVAVRRALEGGEAASRPEPGRRKVMVSHQFVTGGLRSESEELSVGGSDQVDASVFDGFDYVALGHLHRAQSLEGGRLRYCGSPLKYSFSEAGRPKSVSMVELGEKGRLDVRELALRPLRDMRDVRGSYMELTAREFYEGSNREDYVRAILTDEQDVPGGVDKLRAVYHNLMRLEYDNHRTREKREIGGTLECERQTPLELFSEFYEKQNNLPLGEEESKIAQEMIRRIWEEMS